LVICEKYKKDTIVKVATHSTGKWSERTEVESDQLDVFAKTPSN
jgi:hypothetical protein